MEGQVRVQENSCSPARGFQREKKVAEGFCLLVFTGGAFGLGLG